MPTVGLVTPVSKAPVVLSLFGGGSSSALPGGCLCLRPHHFGTIAYFSIALSPAVGSSLAIGVGGTSLPSLPLLSMLLVCRPFGLSTLAREARAVLEAAGGCGIVIGSALAFGPASSP